MLFLIAVILDVLIFNQIQNLNAHSNAFSSIVSRLLQSTRLEDLTLPSIVSSKQNGWRSYAPNLAKVTIVGSNEKVKIKHYEEDERLIISQLQKIENDAFMSCPIRSLFIPSKINHIAMDAFAFCYLFLLIEIDEKCDVSEISYNQLKCQYIMIPANLRGKI